VTREFTVVGTDQFVIPDDVYEVTLDVFGRPGEPPLPDCPARAGA
jgi:hypothetical protein